VKIQVEELTRSRDELTQLRNKLTQENAEFQRQIHDLEANLDSFSKNKSQAQQKLESTQTKLEEEIRVRRSSSSSYSHLASFTGTHSSAMYVKIIVRVSYYLRKSVYSTDVYTLQV